MGRVVWLACAALLLAISPAFAQPARPKSLPAAAAEGAARHLALEAGSGRVLTLPAPVANVFVADPKVGEVRPASATSLFLFGVNPGRTTVAALDADGNERAGLRLPHLAAPLRTYTGVNVYRDMPTELCDRDGMFVPFARTRAEREETGDPRPSLEERYGTRAAYVDKVRAAAAALVEGRYLLQEDAERYVAAAEKAEGF